MPASARFNLAAKRSRTGCVAETLTAHRSRSRKGRPAERVPVMLETAGWDDYALLDSGNGRKLERYGTCRIVRPEAQALWTPRLPQDAWERADAVFVGSGDEDGEGPAGRWRYRKPLGETWTLSRDGVAFLGRLTSFRHVGLFPEQVTHWDWMTERIAGRAGGRPPEILNLFAYTGVASLLAARAGARVTHIDASKKAIGWARENQRVAGLDEAPIRWICEDAPKFVAREIRRGRRYDGIVLDPPKFGRGPKGEVWDVFADLGPMLDACRALMSDTPLFVVLTAYSIRSSFLSLHELMAERLDGLGGLIESGELVLREQGEDGRRLSTSLFSRWSSDG